MAKTKPSAPTTTPMLTLDDFKPHTSRLVLIHPFKGALPEAWIELASMTSEKADEVRRALAVKNKSAGIKDMQDEEYLKWAADYDRAVAAGLVVAWAEDFFKGPLTPERAQEAMGIPFIYAQVQKHLNDEANFYTA